jgi:repressor LexA
MAKSKKLSNRQLGILKYVAEALQLQRRPPTIREIGEAVNISSTSVVTYNLNKLEQRDYLIRDKEVSRGIRLTDLAREFLGLDSDQPQNLLRIPMLGSIAAGEPINVGNSDFDTFDEDDMVELATSMLPDKVRDLYALRVSGDSMIDAMVNDGDVVVMKPQQVARNGEMLAVWLKADSSTTLKYFYHEGDRVRLQPANPTMGPIYVDPDDVEVQGKVVMVVRQTP